MARRLLGGGLLGALLGFAMGLGVAQLLRVATTPTLSALFAAGVGGSVLALVRRPPWRQTSAVESLLRTLFGMVLGAGLSLLAQRFFDPTLPFAFPPVPRGARLSEHPAVIGPIVGFLIGAVVGIEPSPPKAAASPPSAPDAKTA